MLAQPDFRLQGFTAVEKPMDDAFRRTVEEDRDHLRVLAQHHTTDGSRSFYLCHNLSVQWGNPGEPQLLCLYLQRDTRERKFSFQSTYLPLIPMGQSWLCSRGCPRQALAAASEGLTKPADEETRALERRLAQDGDNFALVASYTDDTAEETVVLLHSRRKEDPSPFRVLHESAKLTVRTHTLREGGFATFEEAAAWCGRQLAGYEVPLPPVKSGSNICDSATPSPPSTVRSETKRKR
jgi:hypothetical protein